MTDKHYSENFCVFQSQQYDRQIPENDKQNYYSYSTLTINSAFSPTNFNDGYNFSFPQNNIQQNVYVPEYTPQFQPEFGNWDHKIIPDVQKSLKVSDKAEISTKDLSPSSYCSNIDTLVPDINSYLNKCDGQWLYSNYNYGQKNDFPSCAQVGRNCSSVLKSPKYCRLQNSDLDPVLRTPCNNEIQFGEINEFYYKNGIKSFSRDCSASYNYDNKIQEISGAITASDNNSCYQNAAIHSTNFQFDPVISSIDQQTEESNGDSDIIVEESEEEQTDHSEERDKKLSYQLNKCLICNTSYTPLGLQFYFLTSANPLTMSTQTPVISKIIDIIGTVGTTSNYMCSECLGLINTIDHLKLKLENFEEELVLKFKQSCVENNVTLEPKNNIKETKHVQKTVIIKFTKYKCKVCKKILSLKKYCQSHVKHHRFQGCLCELCGKMCLTNKTFQLHLKRHKKNYIPKINSFRCCNCDKAFRTKSHLKEHENFCLGILPYKCKKQNCDKKFATSTKLRNHVVLKHDKKFTAICSICNIGFIKGSDYKSHMITHSTDKKFACSECDKSYKTLSNLNFHKKVHNIRLPFACPVCDKGFMRKEYLEAHVNNHNGIKNFLCPICNKKFVSQKNLDSHLKYHEETIKKNTCNICEKTLTSGFEEHLRIHSNLKEFECNECDLKFNTRGTLQKHKRNKHRDVDITGKA